MDYPDEVMSAFRRGEERKAISSPPGGSQDVKQALLRHVRENPGIWYRELLRLTGLSNGTLAHHLRALEENGRIRVQRDDNLGRTRYYALDVTESESNIIGFLRSDTVRKMVLLMLDNEHCTFSEFVDRTGKSPSTISWHLKRVVSAGVVQIRESGYTLYCLADREAVMDVLSKYRRTFLDTAADNLTEIIDEI